MYSSFFKRERQYDPFRAKEIINRRILPQQTSQIYMYTSFFKPERQHDPFREKEIINRGKKLSTEGYCHNEQARYTRIPRSLSVSDNMTRLERKKLSIEGDYNNKRARYTCIARSLSVSDNMTRLERKKLSIDGYCQQQTSQIFMYTSFFKRERKHDPFRAKEIINRRILPTTN